METSEETIQSCSRKTQTSSVGTGIRKIQQIGGSLSLFGRRRPSGARSFVHLVRVVLRIRAVFILFVWSHTRFSVLPSAPQAGIVAKASSACSQLQYIQSEVQYAGTVVACSVCVLAMSAVAAYLFSYPHNISVHRKRTLETTYVPCIYATKKTGLQGASLFPVPLAL